MAVLHHDVRLLLFHGRVVVLRCVVIKAVALN